MKKSLLMLGVAVAALASCTQNEVVDIAESNVIKFDNAFVGNATKATAPEITKDNITDIYVYAQNAATEEGGSGTAVFTNEHVYKTTAGEWSYDDLVKWDNITNPYYKFAAYAGKELTQTTNVSFDWTSGLLKFQNLTIDGNDQYDLLANSTAVTDESTGGRPKIQFTLDHLLSMVQFTLKSGFGETCKVKIEEFKFYGLKTQGDCSFSSAWSWTPSGDDAAIGDSKFVGTGGEAKAVAASSTGSTATDVVESWVVIPQAIQGSGASDPKQMVSFKATVFDGEEELAQKTLTASLPAITWQPGFRYNYIFTIDIDIMDLADDYITFEAPQVTGWDKTTDIDNGTLQ